jgi:hypothetical protein
LLTVYIAQHKQEALMRAAFSLVSATDLEQALSAPAASTALVVHDTQEDEAFITELAHRPRAKAPVKTYKTTPTWDPITGKLVRPRGRPPLGQGKKDMAVQGDAVPLLLPEEEEILETVGEEEILDPHFLTLRLR